MVQDVVVLYHCKSSSHLHDNLGISSSNHVYSRKQFTPFRSQHTPHGRHGTWRSSPCWVVAAWVLELRDRLRTQLLLEAQTVQSRRDVRRWRSEQRKVLKFAIAKMRRTTIDIRIYRK